MNNKLILVHRGGTKTFPGKNAFKSFEKAVNSGADMIELDIRKTKDNIYIVFHDLMLNGTKVNNLTFNDVYKCLDGNILKLEDALNLSKDKIKIDVELKEEGYEINIVRIISKYIKIDDYIITSFNDNSIKIIKDALPETQVGLLLGKENPKNIFLTRLSEIFSIRRIMKSRADIVLPHWRLVRFGVLSRIKKHHKSIILWTVNSKKLINKFLNDERVDGIITDDIDLALSSLYRSVKH